MEYILLFIAIFSIIFILIKRKNPQRAKVVAKKNETDIEKLGFNGKIKSVKDFYWFASLDKGIIGQGEYFDYSVIMEFDNEGKLIDTKVENNNPLYKKKENVLFYNDDGNVIKEKMYMANNTLLWKKYFKYNEDGNLIKWTNFNIEGIGLGKITFEYDIKNNKTVSQMYRYDESLFGKLIYEYDKHGNCLNEYKEDDSGNPLIIKRDIVYYEV